MAKAKHSPAFRTGVLNPLMRGDVLVPPIRAYLSNPNFGGLTIEVPKMGERPYDGKFHPSSHPGWSARALTIYLAAPSLLQKEMFKDSDILAMTAGSIWHAVLEHIMLDELGIIDAKEVHFEDPETLATGNADGVRGGEIIEIKTMRDMLLRKIESPEDYISRFPGYYLQAIEYMRMSGLRKERVLLVAVTYPFEMKEFVIEYDMLVAQEVEQKYRLAVQSAADMTLPICGACTSCPAKHLCDNFAPEQIRGLMEEHAR